MPKGGKSWTAEEEATLQELLAQGAPRPVIAKTLQRTVAAIEGASTSSEAGTSFQLLTNQRPDTAMHPAAKFQFERTAREYLQYSTFS
jgi:hypothetical protein